MLISDWISDVCSSDLFAAGLPAFVLIKAFQPGFFARRDTATPVKIAVVGVVANLAFNLLLMPLLAHVGIALATTLAAWLTAAMLGWMLARRGPFRVDRRLRARPIGRATSRDHAW